MWRREVSGVQFGGDPGWLVNRESISSGSIKEGMKEASFLSLTQNPFAKFCPRVDQDIINS